MSLADIFKSQPLFGRKDGKFSVALEFGLLDVMTAFFDARNVSFSISVVSACSCPTELISSYLDKIMAPIVKSLPSYIKDSQHAL